MQIFLSFFRKTDNKASTMSTEQYHRFWPRATKTCLVATVKDNKVESVRFKESVRNDGSEEWRKLQLFMLMNSSLSLVVWQRTSS